MFEVFGLTPLIKILIISIVLIFSSFYLGAILIGNSTKNHGIHLLIGLITLTGLIAIITTKGISIFTPTILSLIVFFKPKLDTNIEIRPLLKKTLKVYSIFIIFLLVELIRNKFLSGTLITKGYRDYPFYLSIISGIIDTGTESSQIYTEYFGQNAGINIYHYFDIYILSPILFIKVPPMLGYLLFYLPLCYGLMVYFLLQTFNCQFSSKNFLAAVLCLLILSVPLISFLPPIYLSAIYFPKAIGMIAMFLLFSYSTEDRNAETFILMGIVSIAINPLVSLIFLPATLLYFFIAKKVTRAFFRQLRSKEAIIICSLFIGYLALLQFLNSKSGYLFEHNNTVSPEAYLGKAISRFYNYPFIVINYPFSILLGLHYMYSKFILKQHNKFIDLAILLFLMGNLIHAILWSNNESPQIFRLSTISFLALFAFYYLQLGLNSMSKNTTVLSVIIIINMVVSIYYVDKKSIYTDSETDYISIDYLEEIRELISEIEQPKAIYLQSMDNMAHYSRAYPALYEEISHFAYFKNMPILQPITTSFFQDKNSPINSNSVAKSVIQKAPFQLFCDSLGMLPSSFYDPKFTKAINLFIKKNKINLIIVDQKLEPINWLNNSSIVLKTEAIQDYGNENIYLIKSYETGL